MKKPLKCYNSFKGESEEQTYIHNQEWWNQFAYKCKTKHPMDTKVMFETIFSKGWKLLLFLPDNR